MIDGDRLPTLRTERLRLRWLTEDDADALFAVFSNADVARYWSTPAMTDRVEAVALVHQIHEYFAKRELFQWGIEREGSIIGTTTLASLDPRNRRCEVGFAQHRDHWGHGYVSEALRVLLEFAFETLDLHRIEADVDPRNQPSLKLLEKLGFQREGLARERWIVGDEITDTVYMGLLAREWRARGG